MDILNRVIPRPLQQHFSESLSKLQNRYSQATSDVEKLKTLRGLGFIFISLFLGWASLEICQSNGIEFFKNSHWPLKSVFNQTLQSYSLSKQYNLGEWSHLLQSQPDAFSDSTSVWVSEDACYVFMAKSPFGDDLSSQLWACAQKPSPANKVSWKKMGTGLSGFEQLVDFLDKHPLFHAQSRLAKRNIIDPKEIRY